MNGTGEHHVKAYKPASDCHVYSLEKKYNVEVEEDCQRRQKRLGGDKTVRRCICSSLVRYVYENAALKAITA